MEEHINKLETRSAFDIREGTTDFAWLPKHDLHYRLDIVERSIDAIRADLCPAVEELKEAVQDFRRRLHEAEKSFWFSNCRETVGGSAADTCGPLNSIHPYWRHVKYRRKIEEEFTEVVSNFNTICNSEIKEETQTILRLPSFNTWAWQDYELILLLQHMYTDLDLINRLNVDMEVLRSFLCNVYLNYNQVPFHNFRHAFSVAQMMYAMVCKCDLQSRLGDLNIFILITSCICHDLDHPGFNNIYQINAKTELALRYNDISPLENHHCAVAFNLLEKPSCNVLKNLSQEDYKVAREGIIRCILATDMARHNEILSEFRDAVPAFDFDNKSHVNLLFMILIKVADISNEARPLDIAEPWLECLMQEFFNQSDLEKMEGLPVSPFMDREKVTKPSSQCSFIGFVLLPLFEALGEVLSELEDFIIEPVREALEYYRRLNEGTKKNNSEEREEKTSPEEDEDTPTEGDNILEVTEEEEEVVGEDEESDPSSPSNLKKILSKTASFTSIRSRTSSRTSGLVRAASSRETDPDLDPTETEVEVSERTSKFKISTEASRRNSYERKGSVDRRMSVDRTVSPRMLEERLRPHVEAEVEFPTSSPSSEVNEITERDEEDGYSVDGETIFSNIRGLVEYGSAENLEEPRGRSSRDSGSPSPKHQGVLKKKETSDKESQRKKFNLASTKAHISFASPVNEEDSIINPRPNGSSSETVVVAVKKEVEVSEKAPPRNVDYTPDVKDKRFEEFKKQNISSIDSSPTHSEKAVSSPNSFLRQKKKFSLSLDVLPRRNGKAKKETSQAAQRVSSDDILSRTFKPNSKKLVPNSPKLFKKKQESAKAILLRSFSFRRKSSAKEESQVRSPTAIAKSSDAKEVL